MENETLQENNIKNEQSTENEIYQKNNNKFALQKQTKTFIALFIAGLSIVVAIALFVIMAL